MIEEMIRNKIFQLDKSRTTEKLIYQITALKAAVDTIISKNEDYLYQGESVSKNRWYGKQKPHGDQESNNQHVCTRAQNKSERNSTHMIKLQQCHVTGTILYVMTTWKGEKTISCQNEPENLNKNSCH